MRDKLNWVTIWRIIVVIYANFIIYLIVAVIAKFYNQTSINNYKRSCIKLQLLR